MMLVRNESISSPSVPTTMAPTKAMSNTKNIRVIIDFFSAALFPDLRTLDVNSLASIV